MSSKSEQFRAEGNKIYKSCQGQLPDVIYFSRLAEAFKRYQSAHETAENSEEQASALKNIGMTHYKMAEKRKGASERLVDCQTALKSLTQAFEIGKRGSKSKEWLDSLKVEIQSLSKLFLRNCEDIIDFNDRFSQSLRFNKLLSETLSFIKVKVLQSMVKGNLSWCHSLLKKKDFKFLLRKL